MPRSTLIGTVHKVASTSSVKTFAPEYQGEVSIYDFTKVAELPAGTLPDGNVRYNSKSGAWPDAKERESLTYQFTRKVAMEKEAAQRRLNLANTSHRSLRRTIVLSTFALTTVALAFVLVRNFAAGKKHNKQ